MIRQVSHRQLTHHDTNVHTRIFPFKNCMHVRLNHYEQLKCISHLNNLADNSPLLTWNHVKYDWLSINFEYWHADYLFYLPPATKQRKKLHNSRTTGPWHGDSGMWLRVKNLVTLKFKKFLQMYDSTDIQFTDRICKFCSKRTSEMITPWNTVL